MGRYAGKTNMVTHKELEEAKLYASLSIKEGFTEEEDWEDLTDEQLVAKAKELGDTGDLYAND